MPTIDLDHRTPERTSQCMDMLWPIMIFPASPARREEYQAIKLAQRYAHGLASIDTHPAALPPAFFSQSLQPLKRGPSYWKMRGHAMLHGHIAGQLLILIKQIEESGYEGSVTKAKRAYEGYARTMHGENIYRDFPRGHSKLSEIWSNYKSVAHLWAAVQLLRGKDPLQLLRGKVIPQWGGLSSPEGFLLFLAYAEFWRYFGITHIAVPTRRRDLAPVVSDEETWSMSAGFDLLKVDFPRPSAVRPAKSYFGKRTKRRRQKVKNDNKSSMLDASRRWSHACKVLVMLDSVAVSDQHLPGRFSALRTLPQSASEHVSKMYLKN